MASGASVRAARTADGTLPAVGRRRRSRRTREQRRERRGQLHFGSRASPDGVRERQRRAVGGEDVGPHVAVSAGGGGSKTAGAPASRTWDRDLLTAPHEIHAAPGVSAAGPRDFHPQRPRRPRARASRRSWPCRGPTSRERGRRQRGRRHDDHAALADPVEDGRGATARLRTRARSPRRRSDRRARRCQSLEPTAAMRRPAAAACPTSAIAWAMSVAPGFEISMPSTPRGTAWSQAQRAQSSKGWLMENSAPWAWRRSRVVDGGSRRAGRGSRRSRARPPSPHTLAWPPGVVTSSPAIPGGPSASTALELVGGVVVVGDGEEVEPGSPGLLRQLGRGQLAVAVNGVRVQAARIPSGFSPQRLGRGARRGPAPCPPGRSRFAPSRSPPRPRSQPCRGRAAHATPRGDRAGPVAGRRIVRRRRISPSVRRRSIRGTPGCRVPGIPARAGRDR